MSTGLETTDATRLLACYASIEAASASMLDAARANDWERVDEEQARCAGLVRQARLLGLRTPLGRDAQREKLRILRRILQTEALLRRLSFPWTQRQDVLLAGPSRRGLAGVAPG
jgi:hypothetical protein